MADDKSQMMEFVKRAAEEMKRRFDVQAVYLFGSQVKGTPHKWSDIDVAVFLRRFDSAPLRDRVKAIVDVQREVSDDLEFHFFDESDPATHESVSFAAEVRKTGVRVG